MNMITFKETLDKEGIIFSFSGTISQSILSSIAETIEKELLTAGISFTLIQNIFAVFTEQIQNMMSYSHERIPLGNNAFESPGVCVVGYDKNMGHYYVCSANIMCIEDEPELRKKLDKLIDMNKAEVRQYYKELRRCGENKHERGAGLGFLEMAKRSAVPMQYSILHLENSRAFFEIKVYI